MLRLSFWRALFRTPAKPTAEDLIAAAERWEWSKVKAFLKRNPDLVFEANYPACYKRTCLHWVANHTSYVGHYLELAELLIARKADVNARDAEGKTPLHYAALQEGETAIAELLLANGADVNAKDGSGYTPLYWAEFNSHLPVPAMPRLLRKHGGHE